MGDFTTIMNEEFEPGFGRDNIIGLLSYDDMLIVLEGRSRKMS